MTDCIGPAFKHQFDLISTGLSDLSLPEPFQSKLLEHVGEKDNFLTPFFLYPGMKISSKHFLFAVNEIETRGQLTRLFAFFEELEAILRSQ